MKTAVRNLILILFSCLMYASTGNAQQEIPEAAKGHLKAGASLIEKAEKPADFLEAMNEFEAAATLAPQWPDIHYNLAELASEVDKPAKAIKEYGAYLTLQPEASDRAKVEEEIARMKEMIGTKRKIGLPGVTFASMPDGIWVINVSPGSRIEQKGNGLAKGDKIIAIEGKSVVGYTLNDFFKMVEAGSANRGVISESGKERMYSRFNRGDKTPGPVLIIGVKRAKSDVKIDILLKKDVFHSNIIEIEEDEFADEVIKADLPVVVIFWANWCGPCQEFTPIVDAEAAKLVGKLKFVSINVDENKKLAQQFAVKGIPTMMVFKSGNMVSSDTGRLSSEKVASILGSAATQ